MGIFSGIFGEVQTERTATGNAPRVERRPENDTTPDYHAPRRDGESLEQKSRSWQAEVDGTCLSLKVSHVNVIKESQEVMDGAVWSERAREIFLSVNKVISTHSSKYCTRPACVDIVFHMEEKAAAPAEEARQAADKPEPKDECIEVRKPRWKFEDIYMPDTTRREIQKALLIARHREKLFDEWQLGTGQGHGRAIVFNFYGPSGTGKSMTAEAIAGELGKKLYVVNYAELESKYVGETPKNIVACFKKAEEENAVLVFDEADSFLGKRLTSVTQSADYGVNVTRSVMLLQLESFDGVVIFTTNLVSNYDEAFKRRILASIPFELPDVSGREKIWSIYLGRGVAVADEITPASLAYWYDSLSGADIKDMLLHAAVAALYRDEEKPLLAKTDFDGAYQMIRQRQKPESESWAQNISVKHERISEEQYLKETGQKDD